MCALRAIPASFQNVGSAGMAYPIYRLSQACLPLHSPVSWRSSHNFNYSFDLNRHVEGKRSHPDGATGVPSAIPFPCSAQKNSLFHCVGVIDKAGRVPFFDHTKRDWTNNNSHEKLGRRLLWRALQQRKLTRNKWPAIRVLRQWSNMVGRPRNG